MGRKEIVLGLQRVVAAYVGGGILKEFMIRALTLGKGQYRAHLTERVVTGCALETVVTVEDDPALNTTAHK